MSEVDYGTQATVVIGGSFVLLMLGLLGYFVYLIFWVPNAATMDVEVFYLTACDRDLGSVDCSPREVYGGYCAPPCAPGSAGCITNEVNEIDCGPAVRDARCEGFCAGLTSGTARLCDYLDSCGAEREDAPELFAVCGRGACGPGALTECDEARVRQFYLGGLATKVQTKAWCDINYLRAWFSTDHASPMRTVCGRLCGFYNPVDPDDEGAQLRTTA